MKIKDYIEMEINEIRRIIDSPIDPPGRIKILRLQGMLTAYQNVLNHLLIESEDHPYYKE